MAHPLANCSLSLGLLRVVAADLHRSVSVPEKLGMVGTQRLQRGALLELLVLEVLC
jgi:hypothetical protein